MISIVEKLLPFWTIGKNSFSTSLNHELTGINVQSGFETIETRDAAAYAKATNSPEPSYMEEGLCPPMFVTRFLMKPMKDILLHPELRMNFLRMLHGEQTFIFHKTLKIGMRLQTSATLSAIRRTSAGEIADISFELSDDQGQLVVSGLSSFIVLSSEDKPPPTTENDEEEKQDRTDETRYSSREFETTKAQPEAYAAASRDNNPIHTSAIVARLAGLPGPIMHGLCTMAMTVNTLIAAYGGNDPGRLRSVSLRFRKPAFPGRRHKIHVIATDQKLEFSVEDNRDRQVISRGLIEFGS